MMKYVVPTIDCLTLAADATYLQINSNMTGGEAGGSISDIEIQEG